MMKISCKLLAMLLSLLMVTACFAACGNDAETTGGEGETTASPETTEGLTGRDAENDNVPTDLKYNDETVTFLTRSGVDFWTYELACEELLNQPVYDAIHYRNIDVENRLGVKIKTIAQAGDYASISAWNQTLSTSVLTNTGDYDAAAIYPSQSSPMAKDGIFYNLNWVSREYGNGYVELTKPWWNQTLINEATAFGALYYLAGDLTISNAYATGCLFFNKDLFDENFPEEGVNALYDSVRKGTWTIDKMIGYVSEVWVDLDSSGTATDGDILGWNDLAKNGAYTNMDLWLYAMGLSLTELNSDGTPEISILYDVNTMPAFEKLQKLYYGNPGAYGSSQNTAGSADAVQTTLQNGNLLFSPEKGLDSGSLMRDSTVNYGVLPLPKFDETQENYRTSFGNSASFIILCSNLNEERAIMMSAVLEAMAASSYKTVIPVYYGTVLQGQYSKDQPDAEMYDLILSSMVIDFGFIYSQQSIGAIGSIFRTALPTTDIQSIIDSKKTSAETALASLLEALEAVSDQ